MTNHHFLKLTAVIAITSVTLLSSENPTYAVSFNAANDFSDISNPNGVWRYGFSNTLGGTFNLYTNNADPVFPPASLQAWNRPSNTNPSVFHNYTASTFNFFTISLAPNQLALHPGPLGEYSIVRWIAPQSGNYSLSTSFIGVDVAGTTTDVHVIQNNTSLFSNSIIGFGNTKSFSSNLSLVAGAIIDFAVGFGGNGFSADSTGLDVTITQENTQPIPESSNILGLFLVAGISLFTGIKFKKKEESKTDAVHK